MAKKKTKSKIKMKLNYDAPVTIIFTLLSVLLFVLDWFLLKNKLNSTILITPTCDGEFQFSFKSFFSYLRLFLYVFGSGEALSFFAKLVIISLLGSAMEERYGSMVIGIMIFVATIFTGVLSACCCKLPFSGSDAVVFMLILLDMLFHISKKAISVSSALATCLFIACQFIQKNPNGTVGVLIILAGGLCGSLFAFMASPKSRARKTGGDSGASKSAKKKEESKSASDAYAYSAPTVSANDSSSDETVVGSIKF